MEKILFIENVRQFWVNMGLVTESNSNITIYNANKNIEKNFEVFYPTIKYNNKDLFFYAHPNVFDFEMNLVFTCREGEGFECLYKDVFICSRKIDFKRRQLLLYVNQIPSAESDVYSYSLFTKFDEYIVLSNEDSKITVLSSIDLSLFWHLSFQELTGVENIELHSDLVVVGNKLFFYLTNRLHNGVASTFCIDINSGKLIKEIPEFTGDVKLFDGMLYSTCASVLEIMNPDNFTITKHDLSSELTKNDFVSISHFRWLVDGNRFYFVQDVGSHQAKVGVVDLRTMKITDKHLFPRKCGSIGTIKVSGNKLYVHTQDETLHIFEV